MQRASPGPTYLAKNHGRDLLGSESLVGALVLNLDNRLAILGDDPAGFVSDW